VVDSETVITTLDDTSTIKLDFTVPETDLGVLSNGMEVAAHSAAWPDRDFTGTVTAVSSRVDPLTRTLTVRARIPNGDRLLKPGMLLSVDLIKDRSQSLIIPEEAVILEKDRSYALVVSTDNKVERVEIGTGRRSPGKVEVTDGLRTGQQVIVQGMTRLRPVLMTSVSTAIGALPLVLATGAGAESRFTIGVVIISGVVLATALTLFLVPLAYSLLARFTSASNRIARQIEALERDLKN